MKKLILAGLLVLPLLALPARAQAWGCCGCGHHPWSADVGVNFYWHSQPPPAQCGPWYLYWPMEAHFQVPAPTGYPYWPSAMSLPGMTPGGAAGYGAPMQAPGYGYPQH
jgi:hypothetical protein